MSALSHIWKNRHLLLTTKPVLSGLSAIRITVCSQNLDSSQCRFQSPRGIPYEMSEAAPANQMAPVHSERLDNWLHWSAINFRVNQPSPQLFLRSHRQVARERSSSQSTLTATLTYTLERLPSSQWSRRPGHPCNKWIDQIRRENNLPPADLWRLDISHGHCGATLQPLPAKRWQGWWQQLVWCHCSLLSKWSKCNKNSHWIRLKL